MGASNSYPLVSEEGENATIKYAAYSSRAGNMDMEDAYVAVPNLDDHTSFFGVYDGHGGAEVALLCAARFHTELRNHPGYKDYLADATRSVFFRMDELLQQSDQWTEVLGYGRDYCCIDFLKMGYCRWFLTQVTPPYMPPQETGCTACVAAIRGHQIIVGNVGNSRCIISRSGQAIELSTVHAPNDLDEKQRIEKAGGRVIKDKVLVRQTQGTSFLVQKRLGVPRIDGILAASRVIGDFGFKNNRTLSPEEQMAICVPDVVTMDITDDTEFLLLVSNGLWDTLESQTMVDYVRHYLISGLDLVVICEKLCRRALPTADNVTVVVIQLKAASELGGTLPTALVPADDHRVPPPDEMLRRVGVIAGPGTLPIFRYDIPPVASDSDDPTGHNLPLIQIGRNKYRVLRQLR